MAANNLDIGVVQGGGLALGVVQSPSNQSFTDDISFGVAAGTGDSMHYTAQPAISLGGSLEVATTARAADAVSIALGVGAHIGPSMSVALSGSITLGAAVALDPLSTIAIEEDIELLVAGLDMAIRRFLDGEITLGISAHIDVLDGLGGANPGVFRPDGPSGPAGIFRAIDAGDEQPGIFRPATDVGNPGRFKPTS